MEIPLHYILKFSKDGGMIHSYRIELKINESKNACGWAPHVEEYYNKILEEPKLPRYHRLFGSNEYHIKKFPNKDGREKFANLLSEAIK